MLGTAYGLMHLHTYVCAVQGFYEYSRVTVCALRLFVSCGYCVLRMHPSLSSPLQVVPLQPTRNCCLGLGDIHGPVHSPAHLEESVKSSPPT